MDPFTWTGIDNQLEPTYSSSVPIRQTSRKQWTIEKSGKKGQGYPCWWHYIMMMMMMRYFSSLAACIVCIFSGSYNQCFLALFLCCIHVVVSMYRRYLEWWWVLFFHIFLTHTVCHCHLWDVRLYTSSWLFFVLWSVCTSLVNGQEYLTREQPRFLCLREVFYYIVWFRVVPSFSIGIILLFYSFEAFFYTTVCRWFLIRVWITECLLKSPGLYSVFWPFLIMMLFANIQIPQAL